MKKTAAIVLAAGKGTRMRSKLPKVLHKAAGKPIIMHVVNALNEINIKEIIVVIGHGADEVKSIVGNEVKYAMQSQQLGTGHAVMQAKTSLSPNIDNVLVLCGDTPLIKSTTLEDILEVHIKKNAACTLLSAKIENPTGYGRIVRSENGNVLRIVEEKDANPEEKMLTEINTGFYCFKRNELLSALDRITTDNAQGEYYLTDVIKILNDKKSLVSTYTTLDSKEVLGVNTRIHLAEVEKELRRRKNIDLMENGVTIIDPDNTYIDFEVKVGVDTVIHPFSILEGKVIIGSECEIGPGTTLKNTKVGNNTNILRSVAIDSQIGGSCNIGPFSYLRPGTLLADEVKIGDFVEVKNSKINKGSKIPHLTYIGDSQIGKKVNIGAGTITCNYDGHNKWQTNIKNGVFVGSNANLVAPVNIGENSIIGAGSTITKDVPKDSLAVARERQKNILGWVKKDKK